jgi:hypothetical protein
LKHKPVPHGVSDLENAVRDVLFCGLLEKTVSYTVISRAKNTVKNGVSCAQTQSHAGCQDFDYTGTVTQVRFTYTDLQHFPDHGKRRELTVKKKLCQREGVSAYWVIDPEEHTITAWDGDWDTPRMFTLSEMADVSVLEGFKLEVGVLFAQTVSHTVFS